MKKIRFVRHSKLGCPYDDYSQLSFDQICGLATGNIDPSVDPESLKMLSKKFTAKQLQSFDLILCSHSKRAKQTARLVLELTGKQIQVRETENLSEIFFDPAVLITREEFLEYGFTAIRKSLFHRMKNGTGVETLEQVLNRAKKMKDELVESPHNNILCITHSFYMRILRLLLLEGFTIQSKISETKFMNTLDHDYLEGFEIVL